MNDLSRNGIKVHRSTSKMASKIAANFRLTTQQDRPKTTKLTGLRAKRNTVGDNFITNIETKPEEEGSIERMPWIIRDRVVAETDSISKFTKERNQEDFLQMEHAFR